MEKNYPRVLEQENDITFGIIASFMKTKKNMVTSDRQLLLNTIGISIIRSNSNDTAV